jgi:hypothetical protein
MDWTIPTKNEYLPIVARQPHLSRFARRGFLFPIQKNSFNGGICLSEEILDRLLVRLSS